MTREPVDAREIVSLTEAERWILEWIEARSLRVRNGDQKRQRSKLVISITGPVGSGKSTLGNRLAQTTDALVLSTDRYLPDYGGIPPLDRDDPSRADLHRLASDLENLMQSGRADVPVWSFHEHRRIRTEQATADRLIVCEGLFALHETVLVHADLAVYVEASAATRWGRWERIELAGDRGMGVDAARVHFDTVADPTFSRFAAAYRAAADIIVINDRDHEKACAE